MIRVDSRSLFNEMAKKESYNREEWDDKTFCSDGHFTFIGDYTSSMVLYYDEDLDKRIEEKLEDKDNFLFSYRSCIAGDCPSECIRFQFGVITFELEFMPLREDDPMYGFDLSLFKINDDGTFCCNFETKFETALEGNLNTFSSLIEMYKKAYINANPKMRLKHCTGDFLIELCGPIRSIREKAKNKLSCLNTSSGLTSKGGSR